MTFTERLSLLAFGLFTWVAGMFTAADEQASLLVRDCAPVMAGIGIGLFVIALLPGRTARFS
jgi:hypothetical protein